MAAIDNLAFSGFMDDLGGAADALRAFKTRLNSIVARGALPEFTSLIAAHVAGDVIVRTRPDATSLPVLTVADYSGFISALGSLNTTLNAYPNVKLEIFTPRAAQ